ncbi:hypothetical protein EJB05_37520, partial [Eragrostis curvula]
MHTHAGFHAIISLPSGLSSDAVRPGWQPSPDPSLYHASAEGQGLAKGIWGSKLSEDEWSNEKSEILKRGILAWRTDRDVE